MEWWSTAGADCGPIDGSKLGEGTGAGGFSVLSGTRS